MIIEYFPIGMQKIQEELLTGYHISLVSKLAAAQISDGEEFDPLAMIAMHCDMALDGQYSEADMIELWEIIYKKLVDKRDKVGIVNPAQKIFLPN